MRLTLPPNVVLHRLPEPKLKLAASRQRLVREAAANEGFEDLAALQRPVAARCSWLTGHPEVAGGVIGLHWAVVINGR